MGHGSLVDRGVERVCSYLNSNYTVGPDVVVRSFGLLCPPGLVPLSGSSEPLVVVKAIIPPYVDFRSVKIGSDFFGLGLLPTT